MRVEETRIDRPIGRDAEVERILEEVGKHGACYVTGPAGIGKSTVLREVRRRLTANDVSVVAISGMEATALVPLAPLLRLCPPGADDAGAAIIAELYRRSRTSEMVVVVDDVHLLDAATAAIVRQIAGIDIIGLVIAHRDGESVPPAVSSIRDEGLATMVDLAPLDIAAVDEMTRTILGDSAAGTIEWIWEHGRGNPLYTRELIIAGAETGAIRREDGLWRAVEAPLWTSRLHSLLARRLAGLTPDQRTCLQLVAVGGSLHTEILGRLTDLATVFDLERLNLVRMEGQTVELDHPLYRPAILATMSEARLRSSSLLIADALDRAESHRDPVVIASLKLDVDEEVDDELLWSALRAALGSRLPDRAERFSREILAGGEDLDARMSLCEALSRQEKWEEAESEFETALATSPTERYPDLLERWALLNFEFREDLARTEEIVEEAIPLIGEQGSELWDLLILRVALFTRNLDESLRRNLSWLRDHQKSPLRPLAQVNAATAASHSGDFAIGLATSESLGRPSDLDPVEQVRMDGVTMHCHAWLHGLGATADLMDRTLRREVASGDPEREILARIYHGIILNDLTCSVEALSHLEDTLAIERYARRRRAFALILGDMARATAGIRDAESEARRWIRLLSQLPPKVSWITQPLGKWAEAVLAQREGEDPFPPINEGLDHARRRSARIHEVPLLRLAAEVGRAAEVTGRMDELARHMGGGLAGLVSREVQGLADRDPEQLDAVAFDSWRFGARGLASDSAAWAVALHAERNRPRKALAAQLRSDAILAGQPVRTVARDRMERVVSEREQQVVEEVASGASNRAVAEKLFISHRTVESHLRRLYRRFELDGREELSELVSAAISVPQQQEHSST